MKHLLRFGAGFVIGSVGVLFAYFGIFANIEQVLEDGLFVTEKVREDIVIVSIDNDSLEKIGQWPWSRETFARAFSVLDSTGPIRIGLDVLFADPSLRGGADDIALAKSFQNLKTPIVLPIQAKTILLDNGTLPKSSGTLIKTHETLIPENVLYGHVNLILDRDGIVRRVPTLIEAEDGTVFPSLAVAVAGNYKDRLPVERIVFTGEPGSVKNIPFHMLLQEDTDLSSLRDSYVFIGVTAPALRDIQTTPVSYGVDMSGVEIQAQIARMILDGRSLVDISPILRTLIVFLLAAIPFLLFLYTRSTRYGFSVAFLLLATSIVGSVILFNSGYVLTIVHSTLAVILGTTSGFIIRFLLLDKEGREIRTVFSKYVSEDVLGELLKSPKDVQLGGVESNVTVFFSDIRGFTTIAEGLSPSELTNFLNLYLTAMTNIILEHRGVIDKYIGDAIMAFWGAPLKNDKHSLTSIRASLDMLDALDEFNKQSRRRGDGEISIGIGLNSGPVTVGNMGSSQRFDYTVMGDTVNLSSRLEGQTKQYKVPLLASSETVAHITDEEKKEHNFVIREIDKVTVKGKQKPTAIYAIAPREKADLVRDILEDFDALRSAYYRGEWQRAIHIGENIIKKGHDGPTEVLLERAKEFTKDPPADWHGVYELTSK